MLLDHFADLFKPGNESGFVGAFDPHAVAPCLVRARVRAKFRSPARQAKGRGTTENGRRYPQSLYQRMEIVIGIFELLGGFQIIPAQVGVL